MQLKFSINPSESTQENLDRFRRDLAQFAVKKQAFYLNKQLDAKKVSDDYLACGNAQMAGEFLKVLRDIIIA